MHPVAFFQRDSQIDFFLFSLEKLPCMAKMGRSILKNIEKQNVEKNKFNTFSILSKLYTILG